MPAVGARAQAFHERFRNGQRAAERRRMNPTRRDVATDRRAHGQVRLQTVDRLTSMETARTSKSCAQRIDYKEAEQMLRCAMTQAEVAEHFGVTQAGISAAIRREVIKHGYDHLAKGRAIPWKIREQHQNAHIARMLRAYHRRQQGLTSATQWEDHLDSFPRSTARQNFVVTYDPNTDAGFFRVHRRPGLDDHPLIRRDDLDDDGNPVSQERR